MSDPEFVAKHAENVRNWLRKAGNREKALQSARNWRKENAAYHRAQARRYYLLHRRVCVFCKSTGKPGRRGIYALKPVQRNLLIGGKFVQRVVLACHACRGGSR